MTSSATSGRIAIFGATGNVGKALIPLLLDEEKEHIHDVRIVTRRSTDITERASIRVISGNYCEDAHAVMSAMDGCQKAFIILPQSSTSDDMIKHGRFLGDCAVQAGVQTIVRLSSFGIDSGSEKYVCSQGPLGDAHIAIERYYGELGLQVVSVRPTSFFSNLGYNLDEIRTSFTMSTPLGSSAKVNWVSCGDIAAVVAKVLSATQWDRYGTVVDVTGPKENTLGGPGMCEVLGKISGTTNQQSIVYKETEVPSDPAYAGLWNFLRSGGFDCHTDSVERITLKPGTKLEDISLGTS